MAAVTSRYARAFADVVLHQKLDPRKTEDELMALAELVRSTPELRTVWENPSVEAEQKRAVLDAIVARVGASRMVRNLVAVLIDNRRISALPQIAHQVQQELDERFGVAEAQVTTSRPLNEAEKRALETRVGSVTGRQVRARYATDRTLLGGAVVKVGSTVYDGSLRGQLERLKQELSEA